MSTNKGQDKNPKNTVGACPTSEPKAVRQAWDDLYNLLPDLVRMDRIFMLVLARMWAEYDEISTIPASERHAIQRQRLVQLEAKIRTYLGEAKCTPASRTMMEIRRKGAGTVTETPENLIENLENLIGDTDDT